MNTKKYYNLTPLSLDEYETHYKKTNDDDLINSYANYLQEFYGDEKTIAFRWAEKTETDQIYELSDDETLKDIGSYWIESSHNSNEYKPGIKYLHFFTDIDDKDKILKGVDSKDYQKNNLEIFALDTDLIEKYASEGYYDDEDDNLEQLSECAIPSSKIRRSDMIDSLPITDERINSQNYDEITDAFNRIDKMLGDYYDGESDDYELY